MFKQLDLKVIGGMVIIAILLLAGTYFFSQRSYKRFESEIGVSPQSTMPSEAASEKSNSTLLPKSVNENIEIEPKPVVESDPNNIIKDKETSAEKTDESEFDPTQLLSAFGIPEEVKSLLDEDAKEEDFERAQAHLTEKYGQSSEVDAIMDRLRQMSGGPVELDDLTALFEAWIQVLPEEEQENRRQLMGVLTLLNQAKAQGGRPVHVVVGSDLDPSLLEGDDVKRFEIETTVTETEAIDGSELIDD